MLILDPKSHLAEQADRIEAVGVLELLSTAERAECTCPEFCERDHDRD
jgi:hypothetical protein